MNKDKLKRAQSPTEEGALSGTSNLMEKTSFYRPDIDGLRAIAVVGVVIYHAPSLGSLPGGFLGVDVFFVISGFLIANLIMSAQDRGSFSIREFYIRRARRLLPAFFTVAFATFFASLLVLSPPQMVDFSKSLLASIVGASNFYFAGQDPYWATASIEIPFLHTWSLSVEEQFYLFFPFLLLFSLKFLGTTGRLVFFGVLGTLSLFTAVWLGQVNPTYSFYLLPSRAWELLIGVILALALSRRTFQMSRLSAMLSAALGLGLIAIAFTHLGQFITAPGLLSLVPTIGAALIILGGTTENIVSTALASKPLVGLGLISYSLYLWHYPILALSGLAAGRGLVVQLIAIALALTLAIFTFRLVENPYRTTPWSIASRLKALVGIPIMVLLGIGSVATDGFPPPKGEIPVAQVAKSFSGEFSLTTIRAEDPSGKMMVLGDSHAGNLVRGLADSAKMLNFTFIDGTAGSCLVAIGLENLTRPACGVEFQQSRLDVSHTVSPAFVVIAGRYPLALEGSRFNNREGGVEVVEPYLFQKPDSSSTDYIDHAEQLSDATLEFAQSLLDQGHVLVLVYPVPEVGWNVPREIDARSFEVPTWLARFEGLNRLPFVESAWPLEIPVTTSYSVYRERTLTSFELFDAINGDNVLRVYPHKIFCEEGEYGRCLTHSEHEIYYSDDDHLSLAGAKLLSDEIAKKIAAW